MVQKSTVFVIDDDQEVRSALSCLLRYAGLRAEFFADAQAFLDAYEGQQPGCLVLDVRMPGMSGLVLQEELEAHGISLPSIIITGHGDVPMAVRAFKHGAVDLLEKPFDNDVLLECVRRAIDLDARTRCNQALELEREQRLEQLTPREREVLGEILVGRPHKVIAADLGISLSSMEAHRKRIMEKLDVHNLSDLIFLVGVPAEPDSMAGGELEGAGS